MDLYIFVYLLSNVFLTYIINKFMYLFYKECRVNKYIEFCVYSVYFVSISLVFLVFKNPIITVSFNILSIFIFTLLYDYINLKKSVIIAFVIYLILFSVEASMVILINFNRFYDLISNNNKNIITLIINNVVYISIVNFMYIKKVNFKQVDIILSNKYLYFFIAFPFISICLIIVGSVFLNNIFLIVLLNLSLLFLNILVLNYCNFIVHMCRRFLDKKLNDKLKSYKKEVQVLENRDDVKKYINSNNDFIDGILNSKINSLDNYIKLKFDILIEENLNISSNDLLIIIGNLMDNAISGVKSTSKNKDKYIDVKIKYLKGTVIINIKNSFNENTLIKNKGLFDRKGKFEGYGLGLLSVKDIVEKYNGVLDIKFNKNNFETYVLIYDIKV